MHVYVTGASGFVGSALCRRLLAQGHKVTGQSRRPQRQRCATGINWLSGPSQLESPVDLLVNLAGKPLLTRWNANSMQAIRDSRIQFTNILYDAFSTRPELAPKKVFNASAIGYYPEGARVEDETVAPGDGFAARLCRDWESEARAFEQLGSQVCCFRFGVVLDPSGGALKAMLPAFRLGLGGPLGSGRQQFSWVSLDDLITALDWASQLDLLPPAINLTAPSPVSNREFTASLASHLHRPAKIPAPTWLLKLLLAEGAEGFLLADLNVRPGFLSQQGYKFQHPDLTSFFSSTL